MQPSTSQKISYLQFLCALMIIGLHTVFASYFLVEDAWLLRLHTWVRDLFDGAISTFFFLSAVLLMQSAKRASWGQIMLRKARSILLPYVLWVAVYMLARIVRECIAAGSLKWPELSLVWQWYTTGSEFYIFWFLFTLLALTAIYPILVWCIRKRWPGLLLFAGALAIDLLPNVYIAYESPLYWLPVFLLGCYAGLNGMPYLEKQPQCTRWWGYVLAALLYMAWAWLRRVNSCLYDLFWLGAPLMLWVLADAFACLPKPVWWVQASFFLYCGHLLVERYAVRLFLAIAGQGRKAFLLGHVALPVLTAFLALLLAALLRWLIPWLYSGLTGLRKQSDQKQTGKA